MKVQTELVLDQTSVECGDAVTGTASWAGHGGSRPVAVVLRYRTQGRGDVDTGVGGRVDLGGGESGQLRFRLVVPAAGPVSYDGRLVRLLWEVVLQVPAGRGAAATANLNVVPRGWSRLQPDG